MEQFTGIQVKLERQNRLRLQRIENIKKNTVIIGIVAIVYIAYTSIISILLSNSSSEIYMPRLGTIKQLRLKHTRTQLGNTKKMHLEWAEIEPEESISTSVYIKSVSNFNVMLTLNLTDWSPPDISQIT